MIRGDWLPDCSLGTGEGVWLVEICRDMTDVTKDWETDRLFHVPCRRASDCPRPLKKAGNSLLFQNTHSATVRGNGNAFVYVTLATHVTLATAGYTPCLFVYVTIGLARHNRMHVSQSERLLVKPQRPWTDLCAERVGLWSRLRDWGRWATIRDASFKETCY